MLLILIATVSVEQIKDLNLSPSGGSLLKSISNIKFDNEFKSSFNLRNGEHMKKEKRTIKQVEQEYVNACAELGQAIHNKEESEESFKKAMIDNTNLVKKLNTFIGSLKKEAKILKQKDSKAFSNPTTEAPSEVFANV